MGWWLLNFMNWDMDFEETRPNTYAQKLALSPSVMPMCPQRTVGSFRWCAMLRSSRQRF